ncbi:MarR family winged helix-turn-helix transcriptional regulator [Inhella gelatinilytica]|uniref:MarR family transcriptional regulator n=1 Tax=Inhella gelatinilytica TaxID=2795030 RepID=A0A931NEG6_9BURK|nr:MarR family transcriptional regulator [Inhella gelatinilytica]MBH9553669.1 MarR family transcriptional regulator [Inhella gelatinilytica]
MPRSALRPPEVQTTTLVEGEPSHRVLRRFRMVFNAVKTHFQQVEREAGVGGAQLWALSLVQAKPRVGVGALARAMDIHQATASNLVRGLVDSGYLTSTRSDQDRRISVLQLTAAGAAVLERAPGPFSGVLPAALAQLDPATLERLDADLAELLSRLKPDRGAARIPLADLQTMGPRDHAAGSASSAR